MKLDIRTKDFKITQSIRGFLVANFEQALKGIAETNLMKATAQLRVINSFKHSGPDEAECEISLHMARYGRLRLSGRHASIYGAIEDAADRLRRLLFHEKRLVIEKGRRRSEREKHMARWQDFSARHQISMSH